MVKTERQASLYYHVYFQQGIIDLFFLSGFPVENIYKSQNSRERKRLLFLASFYHFHLLHKMFSLQPLHLSERFNDERGLQKRIQELYYIFFIIKTSIRVNKGTGYLDLLMNMSFQLLIIVIKHSVIKLDVT